MNKIIIANWKANPITPGEAQELFDSYVCEIQKYPSVYLVVCPPFVYLEELAKKLETGNPGRPLDSGLGWKLETISLGAQDVRDAEKLKKIGVSHVLVGHSDRRYKIGETDELINKKIKTALEVGIVPILLVGEKNRGDNRRQILEKQLSADLEGLDSSQISKVLITYEPVWAISTTPGTSPSTTFGTKVVLGKPDTPENTLKALKIISNFLSKNCKLETGNYLYGGSVTEKNVADFLSHPEISGAVIGGASLRKDEFAEILRIVSKI